MKFLAVKVARHRCRCGGKPCNCYAHRNAKGILFSVHPRRFGCNEITEFYQQTACYPKGHDQIVNIRNADRRESECDTGFAQKVGGEPDIEQSPYQKRTEQWQNREPAEKPTQRKKDCQNRNREACQLYLGRMRKPRVAAEHTPPTMSPEKQARPTERHIEVVPNEADQRVWFQVHDLQVSHENDSLTGIRHGLAEPRILHRIEVGGIQRRTFSPKHVE